MVARRPLDRFRRPGAGAGKARDLARGGKRWTPRRITAGPSYETVLAFAADGASLYFRSDRAGIFEVWNAPIAGGEPTRVTQGGGLRAEESRDGNFLFYANDVPQVWRRALRGPQGEVLMTTFPKATHWGGDWTVGTRGLYYLNESVPGTVGIDFLAFGAILSRAIRLTPLSAPPSRGVSVFDVAHDESWLVWAQDDYRNSDIMMIPHR